MKTETKVWLAKAVVVTSVVFVVFRCAWDPGDQAVTIKFQVASKNKPAVSWLTEALGIRSVAAPTDPFDLDCFFLNVTGLGTVPTISTTEIGKLTRPNCLNFGTVSNLVSRSELETMGVSIRARAGSSRGVQLLGLSGTGVGSCSDSTVAQIFRSVLPQMYELGSTVTNLYEDTEVVLNNQYGLNGPPKDITASCTVPESLQSAITLDPELVFTGDSAFSGIPIFNETLFPTLIPVSSATLNPMLTNNPSAIAPAARFTFAPGGAEGTVRVDALFDVSQLDLTQYHRLRIDVTAAGGSVPYTAGACTNGEITGLGYSLKAYIGSDRAWSSGTITGTHTVSDTTVTFIERPPSDLAIPGWSAGLAGPAPVLYLSLRSNASSSLAGSPGPSVSGSLSPTVDACSALQIEKLSITLLR